MPFVVEAMFPKQTLNVVSHVLAFVVDIFKNIGTGFISFGF